MAENTTKNVFPIIPVKHWWALREQFKKTIPSAVNESYVASVLGMTEKSARSNIIPSLKYTGIIDDEGKPTERAIQWRDDIHYPEVCGEIRKEIYPAELLDIAPDSENDKETAKRWFANTTGVGQVGVRRMLAVYLLLTDANASKPTGTAKPTQQKRKTTKPAALPKQPSKPSATVAKADVSLSESAQASPHKTKASLNPALNLNIQIHISSEAAPEQIDQIFASMAKHLKDLFD